MLDQPVPQPRSATHAPGRSEPLVDVGDRRQPRAPELVDEHRAVQVGDALAGVLAVVARTARPLRSGKPRTSCGSGRSIPSAWRAERGDVARAVRRLREPPRVPAGARSGARRAGGSSSTTSRSGHGLLLEPLAHVALVGAGPLGQLRARRRPVRRAAPGRGRGARRDESPARSNRAMCEANTRSTRASVARRRGDSSMRLRHRFLLSVVERNARKAPRPPASPRSAICWRWPESRPGARQSRPARAA